MKNGALKIWQFLGGNAFQVAVTFLFSGFLAGALFTLLTRSPALEDFFFLPGGNPIRLAPEARFSWYIAFSSLLVLGVALGFLVSTQRAEFVRKFRLTAKRSLLACAVIGATIPIFYLLSIAAFPLFDAILMLLVVPILFLPMFSVAACIVTRSFRLLPIALLANVFAVVAALGFHLLTYWLLRKQEDFAVEFFEWAGLFSSFSLSFGLCLLRAKRGK